jgi:hypothetical protein
MNFMRWWLQEDSLNTKVEKPKKRAFDTLKALFLKHTHTIFSIYYQVFSVPRLTSAHLDFAQ